MKIGTFFKDNDGTMHGRIYGLGCIMTSVLFESQKVVTANLILRL